MCIVEFLNANSDALMVIITLAYVVATVAIWCANKKAANTSREQITEMKRQYEDKKRLEIMPFLYITIGTGSKDIDDVLDITLRCVSHAEEFTVIEKCFCISNIGNGVAKDIRYTWNDAEDISLKGEWPFLLLAVKENKQCVVDFFVNHAPDFSKQTVCVSLDLSYEDLLDNSYTQRLSLSFEIAEEGNAKLSEWKLSCPAFIPKEVQNV